MPLVVTVFATAPGAGTHSSSDVVASIGAGWSGVPPSGAGDALLWADGFEGPRVLVGRAARHHQKHQADAGDARTHARSIAFANAIRRETNR